MRILQLLAAGLAVSCLAAPALAQSGPAFDCSKTEHEIEDLICQDEELAGKDRKLAEVYKQAIAAMEKVDAGGPEAIKELKAMQRGWIGGRNECWKAEDKRQCAIDSYDRRTAFLQARYFLVGGGQPVFYTCNNNPADEIVATFIPTEPPSVRLERGDSLEVGILSPTASGSRYDADFGVFFWTQGDEARVAWPQDNEFSCVLRK
ncbi:MAG: MliC family protein [Anderseniella sp.]|jgi:uncharacterized protein YecT (DUF1311 family)/membrane-bound inhibitor of C-type lysozyme|nr:MliC family protein [Anderseniella sp.]